MYSYYVGANGIYGSQEALISYIIRLYFVI